MKSLHRAPRRAGAGVLTGLLGLLAGCNVVPPPQTDPTRYYLLSDVVSERHAVGAALAAERAVHPGPAELPEAPAAPVPASTESSPAVVASGAGPENASATGEAAERSAGDHGLRVGLQPIRLATYLSGLPMVVRHGVNEVSFKEYHRWAEPLDGDIAQELRAHLLESGDVDRVLLSPLPLDDRRDYDISVAIVRCEGAQGVDGDFHASFAATFEIFTPGYSGRLVARRLFISPDAPWDGRDYSALARLLSDDVAALAREIASVLPAKP